MRILIIRHGDPNYKDDCLTEKGKREANLLAEKLKKEKIDYLYSSPLGRAKETCETYAKAVGREKDIVVKDWLKEFNHSVVFPSGRAWGLPWDMLPEEWSEEQKLAYISDGERRLKKSKWMLTIIFPLVLTFLFDCIELFWGDMFARWFGA